ASSLTLQQCPTLNASYQAYKEHCSRRPDKAFMPHPATAP
ncbi:hypothetical protein HMPREF1597_00921, partial [Escherichia coli 907701]